jgi:hypothetical protein
MRNKYLYTIFFILSSKLILAQSASFGIENGWDVLIFDNGHTLGLNVNLIFNYSFNELFETEIRSGFSFGSNFSGFGFGAYLKIFPIEIPIYLLGGIKLHSNIGMSGNGTGVRDDLYYLPTLGLGYRIKVRKTSICCEILYQKPYPNGLTWFNSLGRYYYADDFNSVIGFNFIFSWEI